MSESYFQARDRWRTIAGEWLLYAMAVSFRWLTRPVPLWRLTGAMAPVGGWLAMTIPGFRRRAMQNLALVWPDRPAAEHRRIARAAGGHFIRLAVEQMRLDWFAGNVEIEAAGLEHLQAARERGKGAVLVTAHFGNWEAARLAAKQVGCETGIIGRAFNNRFLTRFSMKLIPSCGEPVLQKGARGMRQLVRHVARGGFVMILVDQRNSGAPFLDFLGHPAETVTAAADIAHRTGAALIPARTVRNVRERRFDVTFEPPVTGDDPVAMMQVVNDRISAWIEEDPEQWFWFHRRWRRTARSKTVPGPDEDGDRTEPG